MVIGLNYKVPIALSQYRNKENSSSRSFQLISNVCVDPVSRKKPFAVI